MWFCLYCCVFDHWAACGQYRPGCAVKLNTSWVCEACRGSIDGNSGGSPDRSGTGLSLSSIYLGTRLWPGKHLHSVICVAVAIFDASIMRWCTWKASPADFLELKAIHLRCRLNSRECNVTSQTNWKAAYSVRSDIWEPRNVYSLCVTFYSFYMISPFKFYKRY